MIWTPSRKTQRQRSAETKLRDKADSMACRERANNRCEICGVWCQENGSMHHINRKATSEIRHDSRYHAWLCWYHHRDIHDKPADYQERINAIIEERTNA